MHAYDQGWQMIAEDACKLRKNNNNKDMDALNNGEVKMLGVRPLSSEIR